MRFLNKDEANIYLKKIGVNIGAWNQLCDSLGRNYEMSNWINCPAPSDARKLYYFAQNINKWLPYGVWKIIQIDNSSSLPEDEELLIKRLIFGNIDEIKSLHGNTFISESDKEKEDDLFSSLIFLLLLFEQHGQIISSSCKNGKHLSIQDGYVYFMSFNENDLIEAKNLLNLINA